MVFNCFYIGHVESDVTVSENLENVSKSNMEQETDIGERGTLFMILLERMIVWLAHCHIPVHTGCGRGRVRYGKTIIYRQRKGVNVGVIPEHV